MTPPMTRTNVILEIGPFTSILLAEIILITLKLINQINLSWNLVLLPIYLVVLGAVLVMMFTLFKIIKENVNF